MRVDTHLLEILVCPLCKSTLRHDREAQELICNIDHLAYPIRDGIPVMLIEQARQLVHKSAAQPSFEKK